MKFYESLSRAKCWEAMLRMPFSLKTVFTRGAFTAVCAAVCTAIIAALLSFLLFQNAIHQSTDFEVFWRTGVRFLHSEPIYPVHQDGGMVFKYPPWVALFFAPLGFVSFELGKILWAILSLLSSAYVIRICMIAFSLTAQQAIWMSFSFFGIFMIHFMDGQVILPILALVLFLMKNQIQNKNIVNQPIKNALSAILLSTKIFTLIPAVGFPKKLKTAGLTTAIVLALSWLTAYHTQDDAIISNWLKAATSGAALLPAGDTRDAKNQNLTNLICRITNINDGDTRSELAISGILLSVLLLWAFFKIRKCAFQWSSAWPLLFALPPMTHPLSWSHLYLFALPLFLYSLALPKSSVGSKSTWWLFFALFCLSDPKIYILGPWLHQHFFRSLACLMMWLWVLNKKTYRQPSVIGNAVSSC